MQLRRQETELARILKQRIRSQGPLTFQEFMEQALFHPKLGFYAQGPDIGTRDGMFNTNAMYPAFAFCLARAVEQAEARIGEVLRIVEFGGGTGELGARILSYLSRPHEYVCIERSAGLKKKQQALGLKVFDQPLALSPAPSFVFANEVVDAFPVHRVIGDGAGKLQEMFVGIDEEGEFVEQLDEPSTDLLAGRLSAEGISLGRGHIAEINLNIERFVAEAAALISKGYLVIIDYGDVASSLYHFSRKNGSLRCFYQQQPVYDPFDRIGEQDLTADVDFTALEAAARKAGLEPVGKQWQGPWLENLGIHEFRTQASPLDSTTSNEIERLTSPARLGSTFEVLAFKTSGLPDAPGF